MNVRLTKEQKIKVQNTESVYRIMQQILLRENQLRRVQEHFWIIGLDRDNVILFIELLGLGAKNSVVIDPPEVFRMAVYKMAEKTILVHNHPSGIVKPSEQDLVTTGNLVNAGGLIKIDVIDHIIISETDYFSMEDQGVMNEVRSLAEVALDLEQAKRMKQLLRQSEVKGQREANIEMAKRLLKLNTLSVAEIRKVTGLSVREMNKLTNE